MNEKELIEHEVNCTFLHHLIMKWINEYRAEKNARGMSVYKSWVLDERLDEEWMSKNNGWRGWYDKKHSKHHLRRKKKSA